MAYSKESFPVLHDNELDAHIEGMVNVLINDCDTSAIFGSVDERREYAIRVAELKSAIVNDDRIAPLAAGAYISNLDQGVAKKVGNLANDLIENGQVSEETLDALTALPVPAPAFEKVIEDFYQKAVSAHEAAIKVSSQSEYNARWQAAEDITVVATRIARDIPEIKNGRAIVAQSGSAIHGHYLKSVIRDAKTSTSKASAVNSFIEMSHASQIVDSNPILKKVGLTAAGAALTGLLISAAPVGAAHADAKIEKVETKESQKTIKSSKETVVLPAAAPAPDTKETKSDKPTEMPLTAAVAPKNETPIVEDKKSLPSEAKTDTTKSSGIAIDLPKNESKPAEPALDDKTKSNPSPANAPKETATDTTKSSEISNSTGNKSTNEQTDSKDTSESTENKAVKDNQPAKEGEESDSIKIDIPDSKNDSKPANETPALGENKQDKSEGKDKIFDHLKEDGPIAISLDDVKKKTQERKDDDEDAKDDSEKPQDDAKIETIGQQNTQPTQKEKFNKEITKLIGGNGPIAMSLEDVKKMTKERKDDDKDSFKPKFEFAPSAELPAEKPAEITPIPKVVINENLGITAAQELTKVKTADLPEGVRNTLPKNANWDNAGRMIEYLMTHGELTDSQAIGVVANAMWESSGVNPGQSQIGGPAFGLVQWEGGRRKELEAFAVAKGKPAADLYVQLDFMLMELKRDAWNGYADLKAATNSTDATLIFMRKFERPGAPHEDKRLAMTKIITDVYNDKLHTLEKAQSDAISAQKAAEQKAAEEEKQKNQQTITEVEPFTAWHNPVPAGVPLTSAYGIRGYDAAGNPIMHTGIDYGAGMGTPFYAAAGGVVSVTVSGDVRSQAWCQAAIGGLEGHSMAEVTDPYQKEVRVTTKIGNDTFVTIYAHMSEVSVAPGQIVKAGEILGKTGNSGCSTGPHAHFGVEKNGKAIDPNAILGGAINVSSSEIKVSDDGHSHDDHEHNSAETVSSGVGAAGPSDEQQNRIDAIKKVAEIKRRMAEQKAESLADSNYLVIQH